MYLTSITITPDPKLAELRNDEIEFVDKAKASGLIQKLFLAEDKSSVHIVFDANGDDDVRDHVSQFPYAPWFTVNSIIPVIEP